MEEFARRVLLPVFIILLIAALLIVLINLYLAKMETAMKRRNTSDGSIVFQTKNTGAGKPASVSEETVLPVAP